MTCFISRLCNVVRRGRWEIKIWGGSGGKQSCYVSRNMCKYL